MSTAAPRMAKVNPTAADYAAAITEHTAAVVFFKGSQTLADLPGVVAAAHARGVPVIVDCAAQVAARRPPPAARRPAHRVPAGHPAPGPVLVCRMAA